MVMIETFNIKHKSTNIYKQYYIKITTIRYTRKI